MSSRVDDIPTAPADPDSVRQAAEELRRVAAGLRLATDEVSFVWGLLPGVYRTPEATDLQTTMSSLRPAAVEVATGFERACRAIDAYADELEAVQHRREALVQRLTAAGTPALFARPVPDDALDRLLTESEQERADTAFRADCSALVAAWDTAAATCVAALRGIPEVTWSSAGRFPADEQALATLVPSVRDAAALPLLHRLASTDATRAADLLAAHPEWTAIIRHASPAAVAQWWNGLPPAAAAALVAAVPALIGNLDGVAIADRVAANRSRAAQRVEELRARRREVGANPSSAYPRMRSRLGPSSDVLALQRETAYFDAVAAGRKQLYAWDPDHGSLIEMSGNPATAKAALFVVPGTNTAPESFFADVPVTKSADWQATSAHGAVVAFTVLTGPMPQLDQLPLDGPQFNTYAHQRAPEYAAFVRGVETMRPDLWTMSYEHSYGGGVGSAAEAYGGIVDARFLAASVGATAPYEPSAGTTYYAAQGPDDINRYYAGLQVGDLGFGVAPEHIPGVHIVDSGLPGADPFKMATASVPLVVLDSVEHHTALMSDDKKVNGKVLNFVSNVLLASEAHG